MKGRKDRAVQENPGGANLEERGGRWISFHLRSGANTEALTHSAFVLFLPSKIGRTLVCLGFIMGISSMLLCLSVNVLQQLIDM